MKISHVFLVALVGNIVGGLIVVFMMEAHKRMTGREHPLGY